MNTKHDTLDASFFNDHLEHFAGARTNPYAILVASQACKNFKLSIAGQRRLNKALNDLPCLETFDDQLVFGWAYDHVIRSPRVHRTGYEHLTIIITLAESFHETYAAEVFHELAKATLPPSQITPHIYQWLDLVHFCNGILANDDFGLEVENFIGLDPYSVTPGSKYSVDRCLVPTKSFADAVLALADLTCGKRKQLTLRGGGAIGWIAALAEHFFDIKVTIDSAAGSRLYGPTDSTPLTLIYTDKPELHIEGETMPVLTQQISNISLSAYPIHIHFMPFGGRLVWQNILPQVFGHQFHALDHQHSRLMYIAIGSAYRALEAMSDSELISNGTGTPELANPPPPTSATQLIASLTAYFPTLRRGSAKMERQLRHSSEDAAQVHLTHMREIVSACRCVICAKSADSTQTNNEVPQSTQYCLPSIVETIICLGLMLSRVVLVLPLNPTREGIQLLYKTRTDSYRRVPRDTSNPRPAFISELYDNIPRATTGFVLRMAVKVFAGGHLSKLGTDLLPNNIVAVSHEGICACAAELTNGRGVREDMKGMVRVIPGSFSIRQKSYRVAVWDRDRPRGTESWQWEEVELEHLKGETDGRLWFK